MDETQATPGAATTAPATVPAQDQPARPATTPASGGSPTATETAAGDEQAASSPAERHYLDTADANEIRNHPRFQGILGEAVDKAVKRWEAKQQEAVSRQALERAEKELEELARRDPEAFSERFLSDKERERLGRQLESLKQDARGEIARHVGQSFHALPEWASFTDADHERLAKAVAGKPDDEVIAAYNRTALDIVAEKRIAAKVAEGIESFKKSELAKEREALRKEIAAELLKTGPKPDMTRGGRPAGVDPTTFKSDADFDRWYETEGPGRSLGLARTR